MCGCLTLERSLPRASVKPQPLSGQCWPLGGPQQARAQRSGPSHPQPSAAPGHTPPTCLVTPRLETEALGAVFTVPPDARWNSRGGFHISRGPWGPEGPRAERAAVPPAARLREHGLSEPCQPLSSPLLPSPWSRNSNLSSCDGRNVSVQGMP